MPERQDPKPFKIPLRFGIRLQSEARADGDVEDVRARLLLKQDQIVVPYETQNFSRNQKKQGDDAWSDYIHAKYCGIPDFTKLDKFHETADALSHRIEMNPWLEENLYQQRKDRNISEDEWRRSVLLCAAYEQLTCDLYLNGCEDMTALIHPDGEHILNEIRCPQPPIMLLLTHFGPRWPRHIILRHALGSYLPLAPKGFQKPFVWDGPNEMVLAAIRALALGRSVVAAPDGPVGNQRAFITVAGHQYDLGRGLPTIAYEARAAIKWLHIEFTDQGFLPVVIDGPSVDPGEKLSSFRQRFLSFYEECLDDLLRGDPKRIQLLTSDIARMLPVRPTTKEDLLQARVSEE